MSYAAKIICDSVSPAGHRLTTFEVTFPRIVLAEFNTHRMLARNSASSRAIPVEKRIAMIQSEPFVPAAFGKNQKGMQASETLTGDDDARARAVWLAARDDAIRHARALADIGVHKQLANRLIEPFAWHTVIATGTEWENFFALRCHPDAQDEIRTVAEMMRDLYRRLVPADTAPTERHLPYIDQKDRSELAQPDLVKISAARCARVSYLTHDGQRSPDADFALYERLFSHGHVSPLEHPARPMKQSELDEHRMHELTIRNGTRCHIVRTKDPEPFYRIVHSLPECAIIDERVTHFCGNFNGWVQHRKELPGEAVFGTAP